MITPQLINEWVVEAQTKCSGTEEQLRYLADRINSHLSELQAGNRERALRASEKAITDGRGSIGIIDAILSVVVPGSEEVERLKAEIERLNAELGEEQATSYMANELLHAELAALRAAMPKWKVGDTAYRHVNGRIRQCKIEEIIIVQNLEGETHIEIFARGQGGAICFESAGPEYYHATEAECRASIPVEHLKVEP